MDFQGQTGIRDTQGVDRQGLWGDPSGPVQDPTEGVAQHPAMLGGETVRFERQNQRRAIVDAVHFHRAGVVGRSFIDGTIDPGEDRGELGPACRDGEGGELKVEAVSRFDPAIPDRISRSPAEVAVLDLKLLDGLRPEVDDREDRVGFCVTDRAARSEDPSEGSVDRRGIGQFQREDAPSIGGGREATRRRMDHEVGHDHIGQSFGQAFPFASRGGIQAVDPHIRTDVMQAGASHVRGDAVHGGFGKPVGQVGPIVTSIGAFEDLGVVVVIGEGDPQVVGIGDIHFDVLNPGKSVGCVEQVEGLPIGGAVQSEFLGHIQPGHITGTQSQGGGVSIGDVPEGGPVLPAIRGSVDAVLGDVDPVGVEPAHGPGGEPGAL